MEVELHDHGVDKSSRIREESKISEQVKNGESRAEKGEGERAAEEVEKKSNDDVVIDIRDDDDNGRSRNSDEGSKICRICQESGNVDFQLIELGCDCKGELALSHHKCAVAWFSASHKGNRVCEICRKTAKNISSNYPAEASKVMMEMMIVRQLQLREETSTMMMERRERERQLQSRTETLTVMMERRGRERQLQVRETTDSSDETDIFVCYGISLLGAIIVFLATYILLWFTRLFLE